MYVVHLFVWTVNYNDGICFTVYHSLPSYQSTYSVISDIFNLMRGKDNYWSLETGLRNMRAVLWTGQILCGKPCSRIYYEVVCSDVLIRSQLMREAMFVKFYIFLFMYLPATL